MISVSSSSFFPFLTGQEEEESGRRKGQAQRPIMCRLQIEMSEEKRHKIAFSFIESTMHWIAIISNQLEIDQIMGYGIDFVWFESLKCPSVANL